MARRQWHWYNQMARDYRDMQTLKRMRGNWTPSPRTQKIVGTIVSAILGLILGLFVVLLVIIWTGAGRKKAEPTAAAIVPAATVPAVTAPAEVRQALPDQAAPIPTATVDPKLLKRYSEVTIDLQGNRTEQCLIKGNINSKGQKIYHLPGTSAYASTVIDTSAGEAWFCTEWDAIAAGWHAPGK